MKKYLLLALIVTPAALMAQTGALTGFCNNGASQAAVSGLQSTNFQQGIIPSCTVTVYATGTTNLVTIYADKNNTPLANPFTATNTGQWSFFAANGVGYDVTLSGGISPNVYAQPVSIPGLYPSQQITVTAQAGGTNTQIQFNNAGSLGGSQATLDAAGNIVTPQSITATGTVTGGNLVTTGGVTGVSEILSGTLTAGTVNGGIDCVQQYGADPAGVADSTAPINNCLQAAGRTQAKTALLRAGTYAHQNTTGGVLTITSIVNNGSKIVYTYSGFTANAQMYPGSTLQTAGIAGCGTTTNSTIQGVTGTTITVNTTSGSCSQTGSVAGTIITPIVVPSGVTLQGTGTGLTTLLATDNTQGTANVAVVMKGTKPEVRDLTLLSTYAGQSPKWITAATLTDNGTTTTATLTLDNSTNAIAANDVIFVHLPYSPSVNVTVTPTGLTPSGAFTDGICYWNGSQQVVSANATSVTFVPSHWIAGSGWTPFGRCTAGTWASNSGFAGWVAGAGPNGGTRCNGTCNVTINGAMLANNLTLGSKIINVQVGPSETDPNNPVLPVGLTGPGGGIAGHSNSEEYQAGISIYDTLADGDYHDGCNRDVQINSPAVYYAADDAVSLNSFSGSSCGAGGTSPSSNISINNPVVVGGHARGVLLNGCHNCSVSHPVLDHIWNSGVEVTAGDTNSTSTDTIGVSNVVANDVAHGQQQAAGVGVVYVTNTGASTTVDRVTVQGITATNVYGQCFAAWNQAGAQSITNTVVSGLNCGGVGNTYFNFYNNYCAYFQGTRTSSLSNAICYNFGMGTVIGATNGGTLPNAGSLTLSNIKALGNDVLGSVYRNIDLTSTGFGNFLLTTLAQTSGANPPLAIVSFGSDTATATVSGCIGDVTAVTNTGSTTVARTDQSCGGVLDTGATATTLNIATAKNEPVTFGTGTMTVGGTLNATGVALNAAPATGAAIIQAKPLDGSSAASFFAANGGTQMTAYDYSGGGSGVGRLRWVPTNKICFQWDGTDTYVGCGSTASGIKVGSTGALTFPAARVGTFVCTAGGTITIANTNETATSGVIFSLNTAGGTISTPPAMKTTTPGTGFTVLCGAADTSTYNYAILN